MFLIRQQKWRFLSIMSTNFFYRYFRWFDLNLAHASGYRLFEAWLVNGWFKVDLLSDKVFLPALSQYNLNRFFQHRFNQLCRLLAAAEMFAKRYVMIYFLLLHIFQTTSVNARWEQPWSIQPPSFPKQASVWMPLYAMFLQLKVWDLNQILCFNFLVVVYGFTIPIKTWLNQFRIPTTKHFFNGESVKVSKGETL